MLANLPHLTPLAADLAAVSVVAVLVLAVLQARRLRSLGGRVCRLAGV